MSTSSSSFWKRSLKSAFSLFMRPTRVTGMDRIADHFFVIELTGPKLKNAKWRPGWKVQVSIRDFTFRTYTPFKVHPEQGKLSFLFYRREGSPAASWLDSLKLGDSCEVFGPRDSLDFSNLSGEVALFGDETSFGISKVLQDQIGKTAHLFLEVDSVSEATMALDRLAVRTAMLTPRSDGGSHLRQMAEEMVALHSKNPFSMVFLTGGASSLQQIRAVLKDAGLSNVKLKIRPYWADGKAGLD